MFFECSFELVFFPILLVTSLIGDLNKIVNTYSFYVSVLVVYFSFLKNIFFQHSLLSSDQ